MRVHLFSTDHSCLSLVSRLPAGDAVTAVIVPSNRLSSPKVSLLREEAENQGLPVVVHERGENLEEDAPPADAGLSWMYSQIISVHDLERYHAGILNMHGGVIPDYRGASVLHWAIINGENELGVTWHEMVEAVDAGAIWAESRIPIPEDATAADVRHQMIEEGLRTLPQAWTAFSREDRTPRYADLTKGHVWPQRKPSDGEIEPGWPERRVRDMVRALCAPWPSAFVQIDGTRQKVNAIHPTPETGSIPYTTAEGSTIFLKPDPSETSP